jgi:ketopantoate reductase
LLTVTPDLPFTATSDSSLMLVCVPAFPVTKAKLIRRIVVRTPEEAAHSSKQPFDYVLLCVKALPDVYDIANIIESVVSPQHTCILMNTTHSIGVESYLEQRFPTNVVLSLVSGAEIVQLGASEFEHKGATNIWVGPANKNAAIPAQIQSDMAEALAMTLSSGQVDCKVSPNIRQQQYERMIGYVSSPF